MLLRLLIKLEIKKLDVIKLEVKKLTVIKILN